MPSKPQTPSKAVKVGSDAYTPREAANLIRKLQKEVETYKHHLRCPACGKYKREDQYYTSYNPLYETGVIPICKECLDKVIYREDQFGKLHAPTKESLITALCYMNKPFYEDLYMQCIEEADKPDFKLDFAKAYIKKINTANYTGKLFSNSDMLNGATIIYKDIKELPDEQAEQLASDMKDTIDILGFDPFVEEDAGDKQFLYSTFLSLADNGTNEEGNKMRAQSCVPIVRNFLQVQKIDDKIQDVLSHPKDPIKDIQLISKYSDAKSSLQASIVKLAETNLISEKNNKATSKGQGSWTNKLKKLKDLRFRAAENNRFSIMTCQGMQQVADISAQSILKALKLQDNEYSEMLAEQTQKILALKEDLDFTNEAMRLLLRENYDLKELLESNHIPISQNLINLSELLFSSEQGDEQNAEMDS